MFALYNPRTIAVAVIIIIVFVKIVATLYKSIPPDNIKHKVFNDRHKFPVNPKKRW
jgi:hypothetical protein